MVLRLALFLSQVLDDSLPPLWGLVAAWAYASARLCLGCIMRATNSAFKIHFPAVFRETLLSFFCCLLVDSFARFCYDTYDQIHG